MSGPFLAFAAAAKFGIRLSVDWSTVLMVMFGWRASYFCTDWARNDDSPCASCWPQYHIVRVMGPLVLPVLDPPLEPELPQAVAARTIAAAAASRRQVAVRLFMRLLPRLRRFGGALSLGG